MHRVWLVRLCCFGLFLMGFSAPAWAYKRETRLPLFGCRGHFTASGTARYVSQRNEPNVAKYDELTIEIKNVPLKPGTVLVVYVGEETVGNITVDARQSGKLKVTSELGKFVPSIDWGTSVMVKKIDGSLVIW